MNKSEIKSVIKAGIAHLYDASEAEAIARAYMEDKLSFYGMDETGENTSVGLPVFFDTDMKRLAAGTPLQYVTGIQHFAGLVFKVSEAVLIPRPETEELVGWVANDLKEQTGSVTILDVGTGSRRGWSCSILEPEADAYQSH